MIARTWRGWAATAADALAYQRHYATTVAEQLRQVAGFRGARLLRHTAGDEVQFTSIVYFDGMDAVRAFAGADVERAVVAGAAREVLSRWDEQVVHDEVAVYLT